MLTSPNNVIETIRNMIGRIVYNVVGLLSVAASKHIAKLTT
jgi:hypothetical protein